MSSCQSIGTEPTPLDSESSGSVPSPSEVPSPDDVSPDVSPSPIVSQGFPSPEPTDLSVKELLGFADIQPEDVELIAFIKNRESQMVWETSEREIIETVLEHLDNLEGDLVFGMAGGGGFLFLDIKLFNEEVIKISISTITLYGGSALFEETGYVKKIVITSGAKTEEEWDAIIDKCERVF